MVHRIALFAAVLTPLLLTRAGSPAAQAPNDGLAAKVKELVGQLGADEAKANAAHWALLSLGADAVPFLPPAPEMKDPAAGRLRAAAATLKEISPRTFTFSGKGVTAAEALAALAKQTGIEVEDRRAHPSAERFDLECKGATFWRALDEIAAASGARVSLYERDGRLALVSAAPGRAAQKPEAPAASYHGLFRVAVKEFTARRDFDSGTHTGALRLEVAWEPRLQPLLLEAGPTRVLAGGPGKETVVPGEGRGDVTGRPAAEVVLRLPEMPRKVDRLSGIEGYFVVTSPSKMLEFRFPKLRPVKPNEAPVALRSEGVEVKLTEVVEQRNALVVKVAIANPPPTPRFDSHQSWVGNNAIWLEKGSGKKTVLLPTPEMEISQDARAQWATLRYRFPTTGKVALGSLGDWTLVYRTPGQMIELTVPFSIRNIPLP